MELLDHENLYDQLPQGSVLPIRITGAYYFSRPITDSRGSICLVWRGITGSQEMYLGESVFLHKISSQGSAPSKSPQLISQAMYSVIDENSGGGSAGLISDDNGGLFYLCGPCLLHIDESGKADWGNGSVFNGYSGDEWRYPSPVLYCPAKYATVNSAKLHADGNGNALIIFSEYDNRSGRSSIRAQNIDKNGKLLWGDRGLEILSDKEHLLYADAVPDNQGGLVALISADYYAEDCFVAFYNSSGSIESRSENLGINLGQSESMQVVSDLEGGIVVFYLIKNYDDESGSYYQEPHMARIDRHGKKVFDTVLSQDKENVTCAHLFCNMPGAYVLAWRHYNAYAEPSPLTTLHINRLDADGNMHWKQEVKIELPGTVGEYARENYDGVTEVFTEADLTFVLIESLIPANNESGAEYALFVQRIDSSGRPVFTGAGRQAGPMMGHAAFLQKNDRGMHALYFNVHTFTTTLNGIQHVMKDVPVARRILLQG